MFKWNRVMAAMLSATLMFSMAPAAVFGAENTGLDSTVSDAQETAEEISEEEPDAEDSVSDAVMEDSTESGEDVEVEEEITEDQEADVEAEEEITEDQEADVEAEEEITEDQEADVEAEEKITEDQEADGEVSEESADTVAESSTEGSTDNEAAVEIEPEVESVTKAAEQSDASSTEAANTTIIELPETIIGELDLELGDNDDLFEEYANRKFYGDSYIDGIKPKNIAGDKLTGSNKDIYDAVTAAWADVADGLSDTTVVQIPASEWGLKEQYTKEEMGVDSIIESGYLNSDVSTYLLEQCGVDHSTIMTVLRADCAYELYWNTGSLYYGMGGISCDDDQTYVNTSGMYISYMGVVDPSYRSDSGDQFSVDTEKTGRVSSAVARANRIVSNAVGKSDYYKLDYYKEMICDMVTYDDDAQENSDTMTDRTPWALVNVFDGNSDTNVVCEGYAEAFQYLTELTYFDDEDTYAYSVSGVMSGGTGSGGHKWNIVHIDNANYMADITNSDGGSIGQDGELFLKGMTGSASGGYYKTIDGTDLTYAYYTNMFDVYTEDELTLSSTDYGSTATTSTDDIVSLKAMSVYLTDKIGLKVYVKASEALAETDKIVFTYDGTTVEQTVADATTESIVDYDGSSIDVYVFTLPLWAKQMRTDVSFYMVVEESEGTPKTYSVYDYGKELLNGNLDEKTEAMIQSMLNYGGYTQQFFDYNTEALANDDIYDTDPVTSCDPDLSEYEYSLTEEEDTEGFHFISARLNLGTLVGIKLFYTVEDESREYTFDTSGSDVSDVTCEDLVDETTGRHYLMIKNIKPQDYDKKYTVTVKLGATELTTLTYSPFSYIKTMLENDSASEDLKKLCKSLYLYWQAATGMTTTD